LLLVFSFSGVRNIPADFMYTDSLEPNASLQTATKYFFGDIFAVSFILVEDGFLLL